MKMSSIGKPLCVFCKHWYDPTNAALKPILPAAKQWDVDVNVQNMCMYLNRHRKATNNCSHFESKI